MTVLSEKELQDEIALFQKNAPIYSYLIRETRYKTDRCFWAHTDDITRGSTKYCVIAIKKKSGEIELRGVNG